MDPHQAVTHRRLEVAGIDVFYREAGSPERPTLVLPHGYPCSSYQFRNLMPRLADRWHLVAPDYPGFGYSAAPAAYAYTFDAHADLLQRFVRRLGLDRYAIWCHDYGSQLGLRLAMSAPERVAGLIIQNGDIYPDEHGPKYAPLKAFWANPTPEGRARLHEHRPPTLIVWGPRDGRCPESRCLAGGVVRVRAAQGRRRSDSGVLSRLRRTQRGACLGGVQRRGTPTRGTCMPEGAGRAYLRDLPDAELHVLPAAGHWALETHLDEIVPLVRAFFERSP